MEEITDLIKKEIRFQINNLQINIDNYTLIINNDNFKSFFLFDLDEILQDILWKE